MNISFNVTDEIGNTFLSASKLEFGVQAWTDDKYINRNIKKYMSKQIDKYSLNVVTGADEAALAVLLLQAQVSGNAYNVANEALEDKKRNTVISPSSIA